MLNPFNAILSGALQHYLNMDPDQLQPSAKIRRALVQLTAVYLVAILVIGLALYLVLDRVGSTAYQLSEPVVIKNHGGLMPPGGPGGPGQQVPPEPIPLTPEQERAQAHEQAFEELQAETGFSMALIKQVFGSPEELAKSSAVKDLRERFVFDVED